MVKQTKKKSAAKSKTKPTKKATPKPKHGLAAYFVNIHAGKVGNIVKVYHCDHSLLKSYTGWLKEGGEFLDDDTVDEMVDKLEKKDDKKDPENRNTKASKKCEDTKKDSVLVDFLTVFGTDMTAGKTITACVHILDHFLE